MGGAVNAADSRVHRRGAVVIAPGTFQLGDSARISPSKAIGPHRWIPEPNTGCWLWLGKLSRWGYGCVSGTVSKDGKRRRWYRVASRVVYEHYRGSVPAGMELDHLCRIRSCVNPDHLEPVDHRTNMLRGLTPSAANAMKRCCPKCMGPYTLKGNGTRYCRPCRAAARREQWTT